MRPWGAIDFSPRPCGKSIPFYKLVQKIVIMNFLKTRVLGHPVWVERTNNHENKTAPTNVCVCVFVTLVTTYVHARGVMRGDILL